jgi:hypothetical protein
MRNFKGHFEGAKTFLTPKIVPSAARDNLGVKKVEAPSKLLCVVVCCCQHLYCFINLALVFFIHNFMYRK